jgi:hypothetical protein
MGNFWKAHLDAVHLPEIVLISRSERELSQRRVSCQEVGEYEMNEPGEMELVSKKMVKTESNKQGACLSQLQLAPQVACKLLPKAVTAFTFRSLGECTGC